MHKGQKMSVSVKWWVSRPRSWHRRDSPDKEMSEGSSNSDVGICMPVPCKKFSEKLGELELRLIDGVIQDRFLGGLRRVGWAWGVPTEEHEDPQRFWGQITAPRGKQPDHRRCFYWDTTS